jgi:hypothetical protein
MRDQEILGLHEAYNQVYELDEVELEEKSGSPRPTFMPKSRERDIGKHDDWKDKPTENWDDKTSEQKKADKLRRRASAVVQTQRRQDRETNVKEEKDATEIGITGLPIPKKKRSPAKQHEFEKERRKNMGTNVGGEKYKKDVTSGYSRKSMREEVLSYLLDEGFASDDKSAKEILGAMSEAWVESIVEARINSPTQDDLDAIKGMPLSHSARMKKNQKAIEDMKNMKGHGDMLKAARKHIEGR